MKYKLLRFSLLSALVVLCGGVALGAFRASAYQPTEETETVALTKANIEANDYLSVTTNDWQTGKTYGDYTGDFYNMSKADRQLKITVEGVSKFEVLVQNTNAGRSYTVTVGSGEAQTIEHSGNKVESSGEIETGTTGEVTITLAGDGSGSVYPVAIKLTKAAAEEGGDDSSTLAPGDYHATYAVQKDETHTSGETVNVSVTKNNVTEVVATLTFGFAGEADYGAGKANTALSDKGFVAYTEGNGVNGKAASGTNYIINPKYDGTIGVGVVLNAGKKFYVLEDGVALPKYNGITVSEKVTGGYYEFEVKAGKEYKVYCDGSKLGFYGFNYDFTLTEEDPADNVVSAPYTANFAEEGTFDLFTVLDNNNDESTWRLQNEDAYYQYSPDNKADDYLILPIKLEAGKNYNVIVTAAAFSTSFPETFEVKVGKEPTAEGLNITAIPETTLTNGPENFVDYEGSFTADEAGVWYVAVHATSEPDQYAILVNKLAIELGPEPTAPAVVDDLAVTAGAEGALEVNLAFTAPAKAINGNALTGTEDIKIYRNDVQVATLEGVAVGSEQTWQDTDVEDGLTYTYYVVAANESGNGQKSEKKSVYVGQDFPADIENIKVVAMTDNTITLTWDAVKGVNGGYVDAANTKYEVKELLWGGFGEGEEVLATVTGETTATFDYPVAEGSEQEVKFFGVKAIIGENNSDIIANKASVIAGAPYELPVEETFTNNVDKYLWILSQNADLYWDSKDEKGIVAYSGGLVTFESGKINLKPAASPSLLFDVKNASIAEEVTVYTITPDGTTEDLQTITLTEDYKTYTIELPASLKNEEWSRIGFKVNFPDESWNPITFDNIKVVDLLDNNLSIAVAAPATVVAGEKATITATVKNEGAKAANGYTVVVKAGDTELLNKTADEALESFATATFTAELETSVFDEVGSEVAIIATVNYEADENTADNTAEATITVTEPTVPAVTSVSAWSNSDCVMVYWATPSTTLAASAEVTEDFEEGNGGWTFIDADEDGDTWTWTVTDMEDAAHGGYGYMSSSSWLDWGARSPDNWLVSPEVILDGTFKFWASGSAEVFQVYVSTESATDLTTFEPVSDKMEGEWPFGEFTVDLSAYAGQVGWIAIRHFDSYNWELKIDDITYLVGDGVVDIEKYNIYLDGELATTATANQVLAAITGVKDGTHTVAVSVVYANGKESKPVETEVYVSTTATGLNQINVLTQPVDIYSIDGKLVRKQATTFDGLKGVYVIGGVKVVLK